MSNDINGSEGYTPPVGGPERHRAAFGGLGVRVATGITAAGLLAGGLVGGFIVSQAASTGSTTTTTTAATPSPGTGGTGTAPTNPRNGGAFHPNEDPSHESGESAAREAQENAGQMPTIP